VAAAQLEAPWPAPGRRDGSADQGNATFAFVETISATPNPAFRKIEVVVTEPGTPDYALARLVAFLGNTEAAR
jgi:general secretion pathway protein I